MSQTPDSLAARSTPIPTEVSSTHQSLPGPSENKERPLQNPLLTHKNSEIVYQKKIRQRFGYNQEIIPTNDISNQTSDDLLSNAFSQTSDKSKTSARITELINRPDYSQSITTHQPVLSNAPSFGSYVSPVDPKSADYDVKQAQYPVPSPQGQYPQGQYPQGQYNQPAYPPQQYPGGYVNQPMPQYTPSYQQGYQPGFQGYAPPVQQQTRGWGGNLKNIACIGSCAACLLLLCTSCCQAATGMGSNYDESDD